MEAVKHVTAALRLFLENPTRKPRHNVLQHGANSKDLIEELD